MLFGLKIITDGEKDEAEIYDTSNIYGECEDEIHIKEYLEMPEYTSASDDKLLGVI